MMVYKHVCIELFCEDGGGAALHVG